MDNNPDANINVAVEYKGDVYLQNDQTGYIEEQKNYDPSKGFSFNSKQVLNTLAYFLNIWLENEQSDKIQFGFYCTCRLSKENNTPKLNFLDVSIPENGLLQGIVNESLDDDEIIDSRKIIVQEYLEQYKELIEEKLDSSTLRSFYKSISWFFNQDNEKDYYDELISLIQGSEFSSILPNLNSSRIVPGYPDYVLADLMFALEDRQDEKDNLLKFLRKDRVELSFRRLVGSQVVPIESRKYLQYDYSELRENLKKWLNRFVEYKYFANVSRDQSPILINRRFAKFSDESKINTAQLEESEVDRFDSEISYVHYLGDLLNDSKPTFLFGEIGSGKSTSLSTFFLSQIDKGLLSILIPTTFLKGKLKNEYNHFESLLEDFIDSEVGKVEDTSIIQSLISTNQEFYLVFDGLDELNSNEIVLLIKHMFNLQSRVVNVTIIASGRPIELKDYVNFNQWNCLTTVDLNEAEIKDILTNEALLDGLDMNSAIDDGLKRYEILQSKSELLSTCTSPLTVSLIRKSLISGVESKSLAEVLYDVSKSRLTWESSDLKESCKNFFETYPHSVQRERIVAPVAYSLYIANTGKISDDSLFENVDAEIDQTISNRTLIVNECIDFIKRNFLQKVGEFYSFQSHQLKQFFVGIYFYQCIENDEELRFNGDKLSSWREVSFASAVARVKGKSNSVKKFVSSFVKELSVNRDNTPASAVLLAEAKISDLNSAFVGAIKELGFRPLKYWNNRDSLVPNSYAYIFKDQGKEAFKWFFEIYLNPIHPTRSTFDNLELSILKQYFALSNFEISEDETLLLSEIPKYHIAARTFAGGRILPILATAIDHSFTVEQRCILLADALNDSFLHKVARNKLRQLYESGNEDQVLNGLEIACRNDGYSMVGALKFWMQISNNKLSVSIINNALKLAGNGDKEVLKVLTDELDETVIEEYCRYIILFKPELSGYAATILFNQYNERDPHLLGKALFNKKVRLGLDDLERDKILRQLVDEVENGAEYVIDAFGQLDFNNGVPELYLKYLLRVLEKEEKVYRYEFLTAVRHLDSFTLPRNPEIRDLFRRVITKSEYYNFLIGALGSLDSPLRYNVATVLLVCNPNNEKKALEIVIRSSAARNIDNQELYRLCMKFNLGQESLEYVRLLLPHLTGIPKVFGLIIIYHNNKELLSNEQNKELSQGLLGEADFLDWSGLMQGDGIKSVNKDIRFKNYLLEKLGASELKTKVRAATALLNGSFKDLSARQKSLCWLLKIQSFDINLFNFHENCIHLFQDEEFTDELVKRGNELSVNYDIRNPLLLRYFQVVEGQNKWKELILAIIDSRSGPGDSQLSYFYGLLLDLKSNNTNSFEEKGRAFKELMSYERFTNDNGYNFWMAQLANFAHEYGELSQQELINVINDYSHADDNFICSLLSRLGEVPDNFRARRDYIDHISLYARNKTINLEPFDNVTLENSLAGNEFFSSDILMQFESVILNAKSDKLNFEEITMLSNSGAFFSLIIQFLRKSEISPSLIRKASLAGSSARDDIKRTNALRSAVFTIKRVTLGSRQWKMEYSQFLNNLIESSTSSDQIIETFRELFDQDLEIAPSHILKLFNAFSDDTYLFNLDFVYWICESSKSFENDDKDHLVNELEKILETNLDFSSDKFLHNNSNIMTWTLSILILSLRQETSEVVTRGFLNGLCSVFLDVSPYKNLGEQRETIKFSGRDLLRSSEYCLKRIDFEVIREILDVGTKSDSVEIAAVCNMFKLLGEK